MNPYIVRLVIPLLIILPFVYLRLSRMMKPQKLKLNRLWVRPAIMIFVAGAALQSAPPQMADGIWFALAAAAGLGGGWFWGKLTQLHVHPEDGTMMSTGSQAGMIVLLLLVVVRVGLRTGIRLEAQSMHLNVVMLTDLLIVFTALLFSAQALEIFLRAQRLMGRPQP